MLLYNCQPKIFLEFWKFGWLFHKNTFTNFFVYCFLHTHREFDVLRFVRFKSYQKTPKFGYFLGKTLLLVILVAKSWAFSNSFKAKIFSRHWFSKYFLSFVYFRFKTNLNLSACFKAWPRHCQISLFSKNGL